MSCIMVGQFCNSTSGLDQPLHQNSQRRHIHHLALRHSHNATVLQSYDGRTGCTMFTEKIVTISHGCRKAVVRIRTSVVRFAAVLMEILRQHASRSCVWRTAVVRLTYGIRKWNTLIDWQLSRPDTTINRTFFMRLSWGCRAAALRTMRQPHGSLTN